MRITLALVWLRSRAGSSWLAECPFEMPWQYNNVQHVHPQTTNKKRPGVYERAYAWRESP